MVKLLIDPTLMEIWSFKGLFRSIAQVWWWANKSSQSCREDACEDIRHWVDAIRRGYFVSTRLMLFSLNCSKQIPRKYSHFKLHFAEGILNISVGQQIWAVEILNRSIRMSSTVWACWLCRERWWKVDKMLVHVKIIRSEKIDSNLWIKKQVPRKKYACNQFDYNLLCYESQISEIVPAVSHIYVYTSFRWFYSIL